MDYSDRHFLLHSTGREKQTPSLDIHWQSEPPHWRLSHPDLSDYQLTLMTQVPMGWSLASKKFNASLEQAVLTWLEQENITSLRNELGAVTSVQQRATTFKLSFLMNKEPRLEQMTELLHQLNQLSIDHYDDEQRLIATWQLDQRQSENRLLAEFDSWLLNSAQTAPTLNWTLLLSGADLTPLEQSAFQPISPDQGDLVNLAAQQEIELKGFVTEPSFLLGWRLNPIETPEQLALNRLAVASLQIALQQLESTQRFRIIWNPIAPYQHFVIIVHGQQPQEWHQQLLQWFEDPASKALISATREEVIPRPQSAQHAVTQSKEWFEMSALLNFPKGSDLVYAESLKQLTDEQIVEKAQQMLMESQRLSIQLTPF
ncbi:MAG: hypothetical protein LRY63_14590 [Nitrincola sp.]|nr:hypothetical protein [Nitrincola sp.]